MGRTSVHGGRRCSWLSRSQTLGRLSDLRRRHRTAGQPAPVQVKSSTARNGTGYFCQFRRNYLVKEPYSIDDVDLFAAYVIPEEVWYLIPASVILLPTIKVAVTLCPVTAIEKDRYKYEHYRESWGLLAKTRKDLLHCRS